MLLPYLKKGIVTPMKCGTHTVHFVGREMMKRKGEGKPICMGHIHYSDIVRQANKAGYTGFELAQHIRDPIDRMVSCLNHQYGRRKHPRGGDKHMTLDKVYEICQVEGKKALFPPQIAFWHWEAKLFPFEGFEMIRWLGWGEEEIPHEYPTNNKRFTRPQVEAHPICEYIMDEFGYKYDYALREMVGVKREI